MCYATYFILYKKQRFLTLKKLIIKKKKLSVLENKLPGIRCFTNYNLLINYLY